MPLVATSLRFALDQSRRTPMPNIGTDTEVVLWRGEPCEIQAALFKGDPSVQANFVTDLTNLASITLTIRRYSPNGALLITKTIPFASFSVGCTFAQWLAGTAQQFDFSLSAVETNQDVPSDGTLGVYGVFSVTTNSGVTVSVGVFEGVIANSGATGVGEPPLPTSDYYTKAQVDGFFSAFLGVSPEPPAGPAGGALAGTYPNPGLSNTNLNSISVLTTTSFGLGFLTLVGQSQTLSYLGLIPPQNAPAVSHQFLVAYTASTGAFSQAAPTFADLTATPTTLSGYGITDALTVGIGANQGVLTTDSRLSNTRTANAIQTLTSYPISNSADPTDTQVLGFNATLGVWQPIDQIGGSGGGGGTPGGATSQVQYNAVGVLGGISTFTTDGVNSTIQGGSKLSIVDSTDQTKKFQFDVSHLTTATTRTVNIPSANSTCVVPWTRPAYKWVTGITSLGVATFDYIGFSDINDTLLTWQLPHFTGDVSNAGGGNVLGLFNIPTNTPLSGHLNVTPGEPAAPASGLIRVYGDGTSLNWCSKTSTGIVNHGMQSFAAPAGRCISALNDDGTCSTIPLSGSSTTLFTGTADKTITGVTVATSVVPTGVGSMTIPANYLAIGSVIKVVASGLLGLANTGITVTPQLTFAGTTLVTGAGTLGAFSNQTWELVIYVTCRSIGSTGTVQVQGAFRAYAGTTIPAFGMISSSPVTIDTTTASLLDLTMAFSSASSSNTLTVSTFLVA